MIQGLGGEPAPQGRGQIPEANYGKGMPTDSSGMVTQEEASPEEQELYDRIVSLAILALHDEKMLPKHVEFMKAAGDPVQAVGEVAAQIGMRVYTKARDSGVEIPGDVMLHAGKEIVEAVVEVAEAAGIAEFDEKMMEFAFYAAADNFSKAAEQMGVYTEDKKVQDFTEMDELANSGKLDGFLSELKGARAGGGGQ